ncbi:hypothetical protein F4781DRAFT_389490 [Annulohypoxylon bovei var. microspora]|nr:hypothetical protein F4781DRAFT_389490 [Annulohypoxylon bovei var. microspora]
MGNMSHSTNSFNEGHSVAEDLHSMGTLSTSDSKSYDTIFSRNLHLACHSPCPTTPLHSRPSTPVQCQGNRMDADLRGIGHLDESSNSNRLKAIVPRSGAYHENYQSDSDVKFHTFDSFTFTSTSPENRHFEKGDTFMDCQDDIAATPNKSWSTGYSPNPSTVDGLLVNPPSPGPFSISESSNKSDEDFEDEDLDLEKSADNALSEWFGIGIRRLIRPAPVICAFEQAKKQCASILRNEGYCLPDDRYEQENGDNQDVQMDPYDAGESSGPSRVGGISSDKTNTSPFNDKKSSCDSSLHAGSSSESYVKVRGKNKRHRTEGELSCPYRKRNPLRFNVRDHEKCANTSYPNMSQLKKHLTSHHLKIDSSSRTCARCQQSFPQGYNIIMHYRQCTSPPQTQTNTQQANPEDGFDEEIESRLTTRGNGRIGDWIELYKTLFPDDQMIPESDFDPVVEDHEVAEKYQRIKPEIDREIKELTSRPHSAQDLISLFERAVGDFLERPAVIIRNLQDHSDHSDLEMQTLHYPGNDYVHIETEGNESINDPPSLGRQAETFITPQYMTPNDSQAEALGGPQHFLGSSQDVGLTSIYPNSQTAMGMIEPPFPVERSNPRQMEAPLSHPYFVRASNTYDNTTVAAVDPMPWLYRCQNRNQDSLPPRDTMSLPDNEFFQAPDGVGATEDFWNLSSDYQFPAHNHGRPHSNRNMF